MLDNMLVRLSSGARLVMLPVTISSDGLTKALTFLFLLAVGATNELRRNGLTIISRTAEEEKNDEVAHNLLDLINSALDAARAVRPGWGVVPDKLAQITWEMRDSENGERKMVLRKIKLIKQVRDVTGMGLREAKEAVEAATFDTASSFVPKAPASTLPEDGYAILTCEHLGLREIINVPRDWRDGIKNIDGADVWMGYKEPTITGDIKYNKDGILFWYYECILPYNDMDLFRNVRHFVDSCSLTEACPLVYTKTGLVKS